MKSKTILLLILRILVCSPLVVGAQSPPYSIGVVGYVNRTFSAGNNLFGNPLSCPDNSISLVIPGAPDGTTVSLWDSASESFVLTSTFSLGLWSVDFLLEPGQGALLSTPANFTNTFVGTVLMPDGSPAFVEPIPPPPPFSGPDGIYLRECVTPMALSGTNVFMFLFGRSPLEGEQVMMLDEASQIWRTTTFASGVWDNGDPSLGVGEAAFFNLGAAAGNFGPSMVPEPSSAWLIVLVGAGVLLRRPASRP